MHFKIVSELPKHILCLHGLEEIPLQCVERILSMVSELVKIHTHFNKNTALH
jgi:hypothetical protein